MNTTFKLLIYIVNWNWEDFSVKRTQNIAKNKQSDSEYKPLEDKLEEIEEINNEIHEEPEEEILPVRTIKQTELILPKESEWHTKEKKFSYFPSAYKMSTFENQELNQAELKKAEHSEQSGAWIYLQQSDSAFNNKRKYSEMIRLDKLDKGENSPFHIPSNPNNYENSAKKRINKLISKEQRRSRLMTETAWIFGDRMSGGLSPNNNNSFSSANLNQLKLESIKKLREKASEIHENELNLNGTNNQSSVGRASRKPSITSTNSKIVNVIVLKKEPETVKDIQSFNRLRLQTF